MALMSIAVPLELLHAHFGFGRLFSRRLRYLGHPRYGKEQHAYDKRGVLECGADDLDRINNAGRDEIGRA